MAEASIGEHTVVCVSVTSVICCHLSEKVEWDYKVLRLLMCCIFTVGNYLGVILLRLLKVSHFHLRRSLC